MYTTGSEKPHKKQYGFIESYFEKVDHEKQYTFVLKLPD